ncbi:DUF4065 domain-containing protein [Chitinophaga silvatica]|uniref:DUF4065 domain-containing protein n=1 Tax=Chitinophaga silvatica TaxID=2282649 RepID=A0A3E1Y6C0_9BACT|nr:type II toxin-antitoxin system antitoxin SocA domain-containing protein [Chitinophaga silvatica]RFS20461.1 DUF4065 domain-containing protein [Chitinophaga silvatica]
MSYTANKVADWFLAHLNTNAGDTISPLKLQKLVYYAQAWHLTKFNKPLFDEPIEAWVHGPVVPSLFYRFKDTCREGIINSLEVSDVTDFPFATNQLLEEVYFVYGEHSAGYLEKLTHSEPPWIEARRGLQIYEKNDTKITHEAMIEYYSSLQME